MSTAVRQWFDAVIGSLLQTGTGLNKFPLADSKAAQLKFLHQYQLLDTAVYLVLRELTSKQVEALK